MPPLSSRYACLKDKPEICFPFKCITQLGINCYRKNTMYTHRESNPGSATMTIVMEATQLDVLFSHKTFFTLACSLPSIFFVKIMLLCSSKRIYLSFLTSSEDSTINQYPNPLVCQKNVTSLSLSVTRLEDLLDFGQLFKAFVNN